jgi:hypothetical protein
MKILARNSGPLLQGAPQLGEKDLAKIRRAGNSGISGPQKFWILRISGPSLQATPQPVVKDLAEFSRAEFPAPLQNVAPQCFLKDLAEF